MAGEEEWEVCLCGTSEERPRTRTLVLLSSTDIRQPPLVWSDQEVMKEFRHDEDGRRWKERWNCLVQTLRLGGKRLAFSQ